MIIVSRSVNARTRSRGVFDCWYQDSTENDWNTIVCVFICIEVSVRIRIVDSVIIGRFLFIFSDGIFGVRATKYENITSIPPT
jgi:hypothetical protein